MLLNSNSIKKCSTILCVALTPSFAVHAEAIIASKQALKPISSLPAISTPKTKKKTHHVIVETDENGEITALRLIRKSDNKEVVSAYPRGHAFAKHVKKSQKMEMEHYSKHMVLRKLKRKLKKLTNTPFTIQPIQRQTSIVRSGLSAQATATSTASYNTGLPLGFNPSVGPTGSECYNFTTLPPSAPQTVLTFSSQSDASSIAAQTNISASISMSYDGFKANDNFSYSDNYKSTTNSGVMIFNTSAIYTLDNVLDQNNPLNAYGSQAQSAGAFSQQCGSTFMAQVPAGMLITGELTWQSSSSEASSQMSDQLNASYLGLASLSAAVSAASAVQNSSTQVDFILNILGGGEEANNAILSAYQNATSDLTQCSKGATASCDAFASALNQGATSAIQTFQQAVTNPLPTDLSIFAVFPYGVAGVNAGELQTIPVAGASDAYENYKNELTQYVDLINQINTLKNRATLLSQEIGTYQYNPTGLNIQNYLTNVANTYNSDFNTLINNLTTCLNATASDVGEACSPVINNTSSNAYIWYSANGGNPDWAAQQNTVALQYTGNYTDPTGSYQIAQDVVYLNEMSFPTQGGNNGYQYAGNMNDQASLTLFADAPFYLSGAMQTYSQVIVFPMPQNVDLYDITSKAQTHYARILDDNLYNTLNPFATNTYPSDYYWTSGQDCTPTFAAPCGFGIHVNVSWETNNQEAWSVTPIINFFNP
jgi:hypothetical protein